MPDFRLGLLALELWTAGPEPGPSSLGYVSYVSPRGGYCGHLWPYGVKSPRHGASALLPRGPLLPPCSGPRPCLPPHAPCLAGPLNVSHPLPAGSQSCHLSFCFWVPDSTPHPALTPAPSLPVPLATFIFASVSVSGSLPPRLPLSLCVPGSPPPF